jgi:hypothetical protein
LTALFPPGKGGGEEVEPVRCVFSQGSDGVEASPQNVPPRCSTWRAYGGKGKGVLIHTLTEGGGMPLANCTTPANGNEREQVIPLLDKVKLKTLKRGRPRKRIKVLAADKGYDSKQKRADLRKRGIRPQIPKRVWKTKKSRGRPIKISVPRFQQERCFAWYQRKYRRLVVRWERQKVYFDAFIDLATIHIWINKILLVG